MINSVEWSKYALAARREGALLKVRFDDGALGYCDCHPWPELGDPSLETLLKKLSRKCWDDPHLKARLAFAREDGVARKEGRSLFQGLQAPPSHFLMMNADAGLVPSLAEEGFTHIKLKLSVGELKGCGELFSQMERFSLKLRIDFNERLAFDEYGGVAEKLAPWQEVVEFIEDPFPYDPEAWSEAKKRWSFALACDRQLPRALALEGESGADFFVVKPALHALPIERMRGKKIVVTSYLDHPIGQLAAAYRAAQALNQGIEVAVSGLLSHRCYDENIFSRQLPQRGAAFPFPLGEGCGYGELFAKQEWKFLYKKEGDDD